MTSNMVIPIATEGGSAEDRIAALKQFAPRKPVKEFLYVSRWRIGVAIEAVNFILIWHVVSQSSLLPDSFLPSPILVAEELVRLFSSGIIWGHGAFTAQNFFLGLLISILIGIPIGMAIGGFEVLHMFVGPLVWALYAVPLLALAPIIVLVFGLGAESKVMVVVLIAVFPIVINTMQGIRDVQPNLLRAAKVFGASKWEMVSKVMFPSLLPFLFVALRLAVAGGIAGAILAEFVGSYAGLGLLLSQSAFVFNVARVLALVMIIVAVAVLALVGLQWIKARFAPWAKDSYS